MTDRTAVERIKWRRRERRGSRTDEDGGWGKGGGARGVLVSCEVQGGACSSAKTVLIRDSFVRKAQSHKAI